MDRAGGVWQKGGGEMPKITTDTRIKRERERLLEIFSELDEKRRNTAVSLIENTAFMTVTLEDLRKTISENGVVSEYQNGENQFGTKKSPEVEVYNTMIKNFTTIIKTLCDMLPEGSTAASELLDFRQNYRGRTG